MNNYLISNMPIIMPCIFLLRKLLLKYVWVTCLNHLWIFFFGEVGKEDGLDDTNKDKRFIQKIQQVHQAIHEQLDKIQAKYKERHDKHQVDHQFEVGDQVWIHISKDIMKGEGKKLRPIQYGPFKILENIGTNAFRLDILAYMKMY
jgi:hypothetical protein